MSLCPICKHEGEVRLSQRKGVLERFVYRLFLVRPCRCRLCLSRFYRFGFTNGHQSELAIRKHKVEASDAHSPEHGEAQEDFEALLEELRTDEKGLENDTFREDVSAQDSLL